MAFFDARLLYLIFFLLLLLFGSVESTGNKAAQVCVVGAGIGGSSVSYFLKQLSCSNANVPCLNDILILERRSRIGGRMATVTIAGDTFEAGASIIHPKNLHAVRFASLLGLRPRSKSSDGSWFSVWDGSRFIFETLPPPPSSCLAIYRKIHSLVNALLIFRRYGFSLLRMNRFVNRMLHRFMLFYKEYESRPVFETVEEMLKWTRLYELTRRTLKEELLDAGLSPQLISELVTVITRINYGQNVDISGLAGAVSLAGSDDGLWSVEGGNWLLAAGLINYSNVTLHLQEEVASIAYDEGYYVISSTNGIHYNCNVTVIATPLDEQSISFTPPISIPSRKMQHTFTTFIRGLLNPKYFGLNRVSEIPNLIGTVETPEVPFSSISVLKKYTEDDMTFKIFSREPIDDSLLDQIFSSRKETIRIDWPAYPHYEAPEVFAPIILDGKHLYYINSFENAASTIETSAVAAENVARLIISRLSGMPLNMIKQKTKTTNPDIQHLDL
ncbi:Farnesylcysteine lyase [Apostasia shenzhenica]|uniref:Farnesylcysteine lyase n=1 Tax=Apostasia shenzhenica TaxID=1088818 RepID=A0A2I0BB95_9ASPA|nr:Farnesylcysteine lyase [Apostasia shenzhenica]